MPRQDLKYIRIADSIEQLIRKDLLKIGDRLPSLRSVCVEKMVSINTASQAYIELERRGLIESRPQSGYFVSYTHKRFNNLPAITRPLMATMHEDVEELYASILRNAGEAEILLSSSLLAEELFPKAKLNKAIMEATRTLPDSGLNYDRLGNKRLKRQVAIRSVKWGGKLNAEDIITTAGCMEAISFCLMTLGKAGDAIAVESPTFYGILHSAKKLGLNVIELPTHPVTGIEIETLKHAILKKRVKLCLLVSNYSNPLGSCMPDENKRAVVELLTHYNVPLIENDIFGDLYFGTQRPSCCKTYDESGMVLYCSSVSKTIAPGYRVGWIEAGKFKDQVSRTKYAHALYTSSITHEAMGNFLENGRYENHLRKLRYLLYRNSLMFLRSISEHFPDDTKVTQPTGGMHLWVELNERVNTVDLYNLAIKYNISIAPGRLYTLKNQYNNSMKLSIGMTWNSRIQESLKLLGQLA